MIDERGMIDLHCHILQGLDDGARDLSVALAMARASVADGVSVVACTPHILPGVFPNTGPAVMLAVRQLQEALDREGIELKLVAGSDAHMVPDMVAKLRTGQILPLAGSRYVLVEPPHHVAPPRLEDTFFSLLAARYVPVLTHPERLSWIEGQYGLIQTLSRRGVWMQITAGSLTGRFGRRAAYWAERMLDEGLVDILATDAHDVRRRSPDLGRGRDYAAKRVGEEEAIRMVSTRPRSILRDEVPQKTSDPFSRSAFDGVDNANIKRHGDAGRGASGAPERPDSKSRESSYRRGNFAGRLRKYFGV